MGTASEREVSLRRVRRGAQPAPLPGNLPAEVSTFVGREAELGELAAIHGTTRLLTLVGPGGVGKTRLAIRLGADRRAEFTDGVWIIDVAVVPEASLVPQLIADMLGVSGTQSLADALRDRHLLLVLDTCEHLHAACADLAAHLLHACANVHILATSRQPLGLVEEAVWRVPPLSTSDAIQLFVLRARAASSEFALTDINAKAVEHICEHLDGLPLALEMIAARVATLGLNELFTRLDSSYALEIGGRRGVPSRQLTLRATLDWSYDLLQEPERLLLRRLAVFAGGWMLEAAEAVGTDCTLPAASVADLLERLVNRSLVLSDDIETEPRYRLPNLTRQYVHQLLEASGELEQVYRRHVAWCLDVAERAPPAAFDVVHADRLEKDAHNLRVALRWALDHDEAAVGLRLAVGALPYWLYRVHRAEARMWFDRLLVLDSANRVPAARRIARGYRAHLLLMQGQLLAAEAELQEVIADQRSDASPADVGVSLLMLGNVALWRGDLPRAQALYTEALDALAGFDNRAEGIALYQLAILACELQDFARARTLAGLVAHAGRVRVRAASAARANYLHGLIAAGAGDNTSASELLAQALEQQRIIGDRLGVADSLIALGRLQLQQGRHHEAAIGFEAAITIARQLGEGLRVLRAEDSLAEAIAGSRPDVAVRLASSVARARTELGAAAWPRERRQLAAALAAARSSLGARAYLRAWEAGQRLPEYEAAALALSSPQTDAARERATSLTQRERDVLRLLADGLTTREIGERLVISPATVRTHLDRVETRLGMHSRVELATWAARSEDLHLEV